MSQSQHLIHILPPQLANQIAAGEVVERPASVVKELVENSLDAGAGNIQIDIEKGGAQLIRIRDNGCGIGKQDLTLALARHATSKIANLEDLEMILSLGFRGEALASISSVSRLTLTSRTENQAEAWQAYAQGREMEVEIQPASHPVGTTVEVANLFFNTPARRKFLRTEKTEFAHIDEVVRRIALAKPNIGFTLSHNGKIVRQYRRIQDPSPEQRQKRVAAICGDDFIRNATHIDWQHGDLHLHGWIGSPTIARPQNDLCYSYVNGRMMRDKTINHAIRQAYGENIAQGSYPAFVVFLDLDPSHVDVNVHPAKHEVRFHQGRLVHDFILQGVQTALYGQSPLALANEVNEPLPAYQSDGNRLAAGANMFSNGPIRSHLSSNPAESKKQAGEFREDFAKFPSKSSAFRDSSSFTSRSSGGGKSAQKWYGELVKTDPPVIFAQSQAEQNVPKETEIRSLAALADNGGLTQVLAVVNNQALLLKEGEVFFLVLLKKLAALQQAAQLVKKDAQPLLIPLSLVLDENQAAQWQKDKQRLAEFGFEITEKHWQGEIRLAIAAVPKCLREQNLQQLVFKLLSRQAGDLDEFFATNCEIPTACTLSEGISRLAEVERELPERLHEIKIAVDFSPYL